MIQSNSNNPIHSIHPITTSHLNPSPLLVATSSLICLPALSLILHKPPSELSHHSKEIALMLVMCAASVCRWAAPTPFNCLLDRTLAILFFVYFSILSASTRSNRLHSIFYSLVCLSLFVASRYFRKFRPHPAWRWFHAAFHVSGVYFISHNAYHLPFLL